MAARASFRNQKRFRLKDAKNNQEAKGGWNVGYNHSHAATVSHPTCQGPPSTPISQESGDDEN